MPVRDAVVEATPMAVLGEYKCCLSNGTKAVRATVEKQQIGHHSVSMVIASANLINCWQPENMRCSSRVRHSARVI